MSAPAPPTDQAARLAAWRALWRILLAPPADPQHDGAAEGDSAAAEQEVRDAAARSSG